MPQPGGYAVAEFQSALADDDCRIAVEPRPPVFHLGKGATERTGDQSAGTAKSSSVRTSMMRGECGVPIRRSSFSQEISFGADMHAPLGFESRRRFFGMSPGGEIASPCVHNYSHLRASQDTRPIIARQGPALSRNKKLLRCFEVSVVFQGLGALAAFNRRARDVT